MRCRRTRPRRSIRRRRSSPPRHRPALIGHGSLNKTQKSSRAFDGLLKSLVGLAVLGREFAQGGEVSNLRTNRWHSLPLR